MPIDSQIYGQLRPPAFNTPFENLSAVLQVRQQQENARGLREQREAIAEQRRAQTEQSRERTEAIRRQQAQADALRSLKSFTPETVFPIVGPDDGAKILDGLAALQDKDLKRFKDQREIFLKVVGGLKALPTEDLRSETYGAVVQDFTARGWLDPTKVEPYSPDLLNRYQRELMTPEQQNATDNPKPIHVGDSLVDPKTMAPVYTAEPKPAALGSFEDYLKRFADERRRPVQTLSAADVRTAKSQYEAAGRAPTQAAVDNSPLETIIGPNGTPIRVRRQDAIGQAPASGTMKPASGVEKRALNFFNRASQADTELEQMEAEIQKMGLASQGRLSYAPNMFQSQIGQSYGAAQRAFTEARLRKDSGAALPEVEFVNDRRTYFAQPGDSKETLEQKRRGRAAILASLAFESGQALGEFVGDADEARSIVQKYKDRSGAKAAPPASSGGGVEEWIRDASGKLVKKGGR